MSDSDSLPDGWTERDHDPKVVDKYDPRQPSLFEHDDGRTVQVVPDAGNRTGGDRERWRVDAIEGEPAAPESTTTLAECEGKSAALSAAEEAMRDYTTTGSFDASDAGR